MDISIGIGGGVSGAAMAAAIYAGAVAVDKKARNEAKQDIATFLRGLPRASQISLLVLHISHVFDIVFGPRQISFKCVFRFVLATLYSRLFLLYYISRIVRR
jgi:hypothetical protein